MEFKGTKGEWKVSHEVFIISETGKQLAETGMYFFNQEDKENAKLIAAAPELLKELQRIKLDIDLGTIPVRKDSPIYRGINEVIEKALK